MQNGQLSIKGYQDPTDTNAPNGAYVTGGLKTRFSQTYGKFEVRFRMDQGKGVSFAVLLWPTNGGWPPEIDFAEDNGASPRTLNTATLHYGSANTTIVHTVNVDMTQWHTVGVEWLPDSLTYTIDGQPYATVTGPQVPSTPMNLAIQTEAWGCNDSGWKQCPDSTTPAEVDMNADWAVAYAPVLSPDTPEPTQKPTISGTPAEGQTLSVTSGLWQGGQSFTSTYQWERCSAASGCTQIPGATGATYIATAGDVGYGLTAVVTATNSDNVAGTSDAAEVGPVTNLASPGNVIAPAVSGTPTDGQLLSATTGTWLGAPGATQTYQWQRCAQAGPCSNIPGQTYGTYRATPADVGSTIAVDVTATSATGTASTANSDPTAVVAKPAVPVSTSPPAVTGPETDGGKLVATPGTWSSPDKLTYQYQWQRCQSTTGCANVTGGTYSSYHPTTADVGSTLEVEVTAVDQEGQTSTADATTSTIGAPAPPANTGAAGILGRAQDGQTLTSSVGSWQSPDKLSYSYQWQRCGSQSACANIPGQTYSSYRPTSADVGSSLRLVIQAVDQEQQATSATATTASVVTAPAAPAVTSAPVVSGTQVVGSLLTVTWGQWNSPDVLSHSVTWERCDSTSCVAIAGATYLKYTPASLDQGDRLQIVITATDQEGQTNQAVVRTGFIGA